ncbi:MAG TPA: DNA-binding response regulator [Treponema sp.]|nr:DNA-binding response regulator [Treponema sp.]
MNDKQTILAVDDEPKILETLRAYLEHAGYRVLCAHTGREAQNMLDNEQISFVLLDLMLPDISGELLCRRIRDGFYSGCRKNVPVIMITAKTDEQSIIHGLNMGADDYVTKPFSPRELTARIGAILRRSAQPEPAGTVSFSDLVIDCEKRTVLRSGEPVLLTGNEYRILVLLASRPGKIFTRDEITAHIGNDDSGSSDRSIDLHIKNLRKKLSDSPKEPKYIETVYGMGYRCIL